MAGSVPKSRPTFTDVSKENFGPRPMHSSSRTTVSFSWFRAVCRQSGYWPRIPKFGVRKIANMGKRKITIIFSLTSWRRRQSDLRPLPRERERLSPLWRVATIRHCGYGMSEGRRADASSAADGPLTAGRDVGRRCATMTPERQGVIQMQLGATKWVIQTRCTSLAGGLAKAVLSPAS